MRAWASLLALLSAGTALAGQGLLGTKSGGGFVPSSESSAVGPMPLIQMVVALAIVVGLVKWVLPKALSKVNKKLVTPNGSAIRVEESAAFAGGTLYVVKARDKELLLCVSSSGVTCLADLGRPEVAQGESLPTFQELIDSAPGLAPAAPAPAHSPSDVELALERLRRLSG